MRIEAYSKLGDRPVKIDVSSVVVYDDLGNPIAMAALYGPQGAAYVGHVRDKDFNRMLRLLGVQKTVICETVDVGNGALAGAVLLAKPE